MHCITKNDMKFGKYFIPARTKAQDSPTNSRAG